MNYRVNMAPRMPATASFIPALAALYRAGTICKSPTAPAIGAIEIASYGSAILKNSQLSFLRTLVSKASNRPTSSSIANS